MKYLILLGIRCYWGIIPKKYRRQCLFKETCSQFVYRQTHEHGFFEGVRAFNQRYRKCRSGYRLYTIADGFEMSLADGTIVHESDISDRLISPIQSQIAEIETRYKTR
jgi:uncharacterized protein